MIRHILRLQKFKFLYENHHKKFRFLLAGAFNTAIGLALYPALYLALRPLGIGYIWVLVIAQIICVSISFISNKYFVFKTQGNVKLESLKFFIFHSFYLVINLIVLPIMVEIIKLNPIFAQTFFSIFIITTSYFWHNHITFKKSKGLHGV